MGMKRTRRRKCRNCGALYPPDYRNIHHQHYCQEPACQAVSKKASQKRWLGKPQNRNYHRDRVHVERVRAWRKAHPGWRRGKAGALQDDCSTQPSAAQAVTAVLNDSKPPEAAMLQDLCLAQDPLFVGFMAHLTGALQEDIALQIVRFQTHGQRILRKGPGIATERSQTE
jgi:hypothetical protein